MKFFITVIALALLASCGKYNPGVQPNTEAELMSFWQANPKCTFNENVIIARVKQDMASEYVAKVRSNNSLAAIRLHKTHFTLGGYKLSGVSPNGHFKIEGSVNYLSNEGTDFLVHSVKHFKDGLVFSELYEFCYFS